MLDLEAIFNPDEPTPRATVAVAVQPACDHPAAPDLRLVNPPVDLLNRDQRELFEERAAIYQFEAGMSQTESEIEAMAELVCTGKLYNPDDSFPWPK
jgi:hypothetical protein